MKIGPIQNGGGPGGPAEDERRAAAAQDRHQRLQTQDSVEISPSGRSLSEQRQAQATDHDAPAANDAARDDLETTEERMDARQERIEQARRRMEAGYYSDPAVRRETARRITDDFAG